MLPIYLDYASTTPIDPRVARKMQAIIFDDDLFGNPSSTHFYGQKAMEQIEDARARVASLIQANPSEIIWTSGATEANNLAIKGIARLYQRKGKHIITTKTEHKAVLNVCYQLQNEGFELSFLPTLSNGQIDMAQFEACIRPDTCLVSIMHVNNETGIIHDIQTIANITSNKGIFLHVDAAQSIGKINLSVLDTPIDLISLSAHKVYGPKGIGALYLRAKPRVRVEPLFQGGGHEQGMRSGTLATHQIIGMGEAFSIIKNEGQSEITRIRELSDYFIQGLSDLDYFQLNTDRQQAVPHIVNVRFNNRMAIDILNRLPFIAASTLSACQGRENEGSYVLKAMGLSPDQIQSSIRFSFGRFCQLAEIEKTVAALRSI